jgi:hypothetical protein
MTELLRAAVYFACEVNIYISRRILESLAAERPMHDEPLPDGHATQFMPDELWTPSIAPEYRQIHDEMMARARVQWSHVPYGDPRSN